MKKTSLDMLSAPTALPWDPSGWLMFGDYADLYWEEVISQTLRWEEGKLERFTGGQEVGAGLRFIVGEENRYGYADNPDQAALEKIYRDLVGPAGKKSSHASRPFSVKTFRPEIMKPVQSISPDMKVALLKNAYAAAQGPFVRQVSIAYGETTKHIRIFTSNGEATEEWRTLVTFSLTVVAEKEGLL
jgi:TldD protein